jgi:hypothetical protein
VLDRLLQLPALLSEVAQLQARAHALAVRLQRRLEVRRAASGRDCGASASASSQ